jgi:hypothetical protein
MYIECTYVGFVNDKFDLRNTEILMAVSKKEHADRRTGTCGEKRRYMRREAQVHPERSACILEEKRR